MSTLSSSFLGKKVYLDGTDERYYVVRYEESFGKSKKNVLLFDRDTPVIFAVLSNDGSFLDSFYLNKKTTVASTKAMDKVKQMNERRKQHRVTQDDLRDALKPIEEAKLKNENIMKYLVDEHLEDIKHLWPSRLLTLQKTEGKSDHSLVLIALKEALQLANGTKALQFLIRHRYDYLVPILSYHYPTNPQLLKDIEKIYLSDNQTQVVQQFVMQAAKFTPLDEHELVENLLNTASKIDQIQTAKALRQVLSRLFKRAKEESNQAPRDWLTHTIHDKKLKHLIALSLKKSS